MKSVLLSGTTNAAGDLVILGTDRIRGFIEKVEYNYTDGDTGADIKFKSSINVLDDNLIGHWKLNDNAASTAVVDSSRIANNGTASGNTSTLTATGHLNSALEFNNTAAAQTEHVIISDSTIYSLVNSGQLSLSFWVKVNANPASGVAYLIGKSAASNNEWGVRISTAGVPTWVIWSDLAATSNYAIAAGSSLGTTVFNHLVFTAKQGEFKAYLNGSLVGTNTSITLAAMVQGAANIYFGTREADAGVRGANCILDDVRLYNIVLTESRIASIYNLGVGNEDTNLFITYPEQTFLTASNIGTSDVLWCPRSLGNKAADGSAFAEHAEKIYLNNEQLKVEVLQGGSSKSFNFLFHTTDRGF